MKTCHRCKLNLPMSAFSKNSRSADKLHYSCRKCLGISVSKSYYKNIEKRKAYSREYEIGRRERPPSYKVKRKERFLKYGLSKEEYCSMLIKQNRKCYICEKEKKLQIDHCHKTGKVRDLLCQNCNTMLGHSKESCKILLNAINYLNRHEDIL